MGHLKRYVRRSGAASWVGGVLAISFIGEVVGILPPLQLPTGTWL